MIELYIEVSEVISVMETQEENKERHNFESIIQSLETENMTQRDRGTLFEAVVTGYFKNEPMYSRLFEEVWMLKDVPEEY